jgi:hypothetical protein
MVVIVLISESLLLCAAATDGRSPSDQVLWSFGAGLNGCKCTLLTTPNIQEKVPHDAVTLG